MMHSASKSALHMYFHLLHPYLKETCSSHENVRWSVWPYDSTPQITRLQDEQHLRNDSVYYPALVKGWRSIPCGYRKAPSCPLLSLTIESGARAYCYLSRASRSHKSCMFKSIVFILSCWQHWNNSLSVTSSACHPGTKYYADLTHRLVIISYTNHTAMKI